MRRQSYLELSTARKPSFRALIENRTRIEPSSAIKRMLRSHGDYSRNVDVVAEVYLKDGSEQAIADAQSLIQKKEQAAR